MFVSPWRKLVKRALDSGRRRSQPKLRCPLSLERLEDRLTPSSNLESGGIAHLPFTTGVTEGPAQSTVVTSNAEASSSLLDFTDPTGTTADYSITVTWGDGTSSTALSTDPNAPFAVTNTGAGPDNFHVVPTSTAANGHVYDEVASGAVLTVQVTDVGSGATTGPVSTNFTSAINVAEGDTIMAPASVSGSGAENDPSFQVTVPFTVTGPSSNNPADFTGMIDWGDGTVTSGTVSGGSGIITVQGTHTYADEGVDIIKVTLADDSPGTASAIFTGTGTVTEADTLTPYPMTISPIETLNFSGAVATFTDTGYPGNSPSDFKATIDWGDGTIDTGAAVTVSTTGNGTFTLSGTHTYAEDGPHNLAVTLSDDTPGTATATANSTANVQEGNFTLNGTPPLTATEGHTFTGTVATFVDPGSPDPASDFTATVDWGDGTTDTGTVTGTTGSGTFTVTGSHTYADEFSGNINVSVSEGSFTLGPNPDSITVTEADILSPTAVLLTGASEGHQFSGAVATFTDTGYPTNSPSDFTATIDWGDGTIDTGAAVTVSTTGNGTFTLSGTHTYAEESNNTKVVVSLADAPGTASANATATITVTEADILSPTAVLLTGASEGHQFSGAVATFSDVGYPTNSPSDFTATIDWGDGTIDTGAAVTVSTTGNGTFTLSGTHTYAEESNNTKVVVSLVDDAPGTASANATATITVSDVAVVATQGTPVINAIESGSTGIVLLAHFTDPGDPNGTVEDPLADYSATVNWGDGTTETTSGANIFIVQVSHGQYIVEGTHVYTEESPAGGYTVTTVVHHETAPDSSPVTTTAVVSDQQITNLVLASPGFTGLEGVSIGGPFTDVATFTDPAGQGVETTADFTAKINWGDGHTDTATVSSDGKGNYRVNIPDHTYAEEGTYDLSVTVQHDQLPLVTSNVVNLTIDDQSVVLNSTPLTFTANEGQASSSAAVATFTDPGGAEALSHYSATIDWGDGSGTTTGVITFGGGTFTVSGSHTYAEEGGFPINVTVNHDTAAAVSGTTANADVADLQITALVVKGVTDVEGAATGALTGLATFTDPASQGLETTADFTAKINWGDGSGTTTGTVVSLGGGQYRVDSAGHTYAEEGSFTVTVSVTHDSLAAVSATSTAVVSELAVQVQGGFTVVATEFASSGLQTVASFTDPAGPEGVGSYSAVINWGDGSQSAGVVVADGLGGFLVQGSHNYGDEGTYPISVTVSHRGIVSPSVASSAVIREQLLPNGTQGTADQRFVSELYRDLLGRHVDQAGLDFWTNALTNARSFYFKLFFFGSHLDFNTAGSLANQEAEFTVALGIENSAEFQARPQPTGTPQQIVAADYELLLDRPLDPGSSVYVQDLQLGIPNNVVMAMIISADSQEYYNKTAAD